jgi:beta-glucosidase
LENPTVNPVDFDALLDAMTLEEQVALLAGADFWTTVPLPRLSIPAVKVSDGPNGARGGIFKGGPTTACFPVAISLASTWNPDLVQKAGAALGVEAKLKGANVLLAPTVNLHRTVLNGRNFECYSEDPWLSSEIGMAFVRGVQSQGVAATMKHFVGNESEYQRLTMSSEISERALRELYLLPFERAVKEAGVMAIMTSYNRIGGTFAADHQRLVTQVLRDEWGFDGLVMSDWMGLHSTVEGVMAGVDLEMPGPARERGDKLVRAVQNAELPQAAVRACARRVLELVERLGKFKNPGIAGERADDLPQHRALIRRLGAEGSVLLKNSKALLPLQLRTGQSVALIGRAATVPQIMGGGSATVNAHYRVAPMAALQAQRPDLTISHHIGADLHRYVPVLKAETKFEYFNSPDFTGPVVCNQMASESEQLWIDTVDPAVNFDCFSVRARLRFVAEVAGTHQFSLISAGVSRAFINGQLAVDAWADWARGDTFFTYGCNEFVATREMAANETFDILIEFSTASPELVPVHALRFGASRLLGEPEIAAAVEAARQADVAVVFAGLNAEWDNEGVDRTHITLPHHQNELIRRVASANPNTVVVLQTGSPVALPWINDVSAVLQAWYPGQECGNAIVDVLLGAAEPGGRLSQTWPVRIEDSPGYGNALNYPGVDGKVFYDEGVFTGYRHYLREQVVPLFAFGHGLSYTTFTYGELRVSKSDFLPGDELEVEIDIHNLGARAGQTVVQLYVTDESASIDRPAMELKAFAKLSLAAGEQQTARLKLTMRSFAFFDTVRNTWLAEAGVFKLLAGSSVQAIHSSATVVLRADWIGKLKN